MDNMILVNKLYKNYKNIEAVKGINFSVKEGMFFAFLGENGAGKSTTINIIATLIKKTSGEVIVNNNYIDKEDDKIKQDIGIVFQGNVLDKYLTIRENIITRGTLYGLTKEEINHSMLELSEKLGIINILDRSYGNLSGGQKRRADIIRALINKPKILILDEPTNGLDPSARKIVWKTIKQLRNEQNLTIFLTTHYMEEAAKADYIVIIDSGKIKATGTPEQLKMRYTSDKLILTFKKRKDIFKIMKKIGFDFIQEKEHIVIYIKNSFEALEIIEKVKELINDFEIIHGNMDDVFINITRKKSNEEVNINEQNMDSYKKKFNTLL
ncbi:MAG: ABC transporter ATP-binding protein [Clostridiales bacterium]